MGDVLTDKSFEPLLCIVVEFECGQERKSQGSVVLWWCEVAVKHGVGDNLQGFGPAGFL